MGLCIYCYSYYSNSASFNCTALLRGSNNLHHLKRQQGTSSLTIRNAGRHLRVWAGEQPCVVGKSDTFSDHGSFLGLVSADLQH